MVPKKSPVATIDAIIRLWIVWCAVRGHACGSSFPSVSHFRLLLVELVTIAGTVSFSGGDIKNVQAFEKIRAL